MFVFALGRFGLARRSEVTRGRCSQGGSSGLAMFAEVLGLILGDHVVQSTSNEWDETIVLIDNTIGQAATLP